MSLDAARIELVRAVCDTLIPGLDHDRASGVDAYFRQSASDRGIPELVAADMPHIAPHVFEAVLALLDELQHTGFLAASEDERAVRLREVMSLEGSHRLGLRQVKAMAFGLLVARFDEDGHNPDWAAIGYPGPVSMPPDPADAPKTVTIVGVSGDEAELEADVCIVGSGAGGAVIAAELARAGRSVVVLEAGGYRNESDFRQLESLGARELYLQGGLMWSDTGSVGLLAGSTLGGGTVINSLACLAPPEHVRSAWAAMGLEGIDSSAFDEDVRAVSDRLGVNVQATRHNGNTELMLRGLDALGMSHEPMPRNACAQDDPRFCGYCNAGCQHGAKQSTLRTYLQDASDLGARCVVNCYAERVLVRHGQAVGVEARVRSDDATTRLVVRAPQVVVAAGALESPALLLRSAIGGPAVGRHLQVHPTYIVSGVYDKPVNAWEGQIQSAVSFDRARLDEGGGFLIETVGLSPAMWAGHSPWRDGRAHREALQGLPFTAAWHAVCHDHGAGEVTLGPDGRPVVRWGLDDDTDRRIAARAHMEMARLHRAAGAREIYTFHLSEQRWRDGEPFDAFLTSLQAAAAHDVATYSAHQMSTCRMGVDPGRSVADQRGELHDVAGVWVGDASALPTAPGVNPMITIMALARRTSGFMTQ